MRMPTPCLLIALSGLMSGSALNAEEKKPADFSLPYVVRLKPGETQVVPLEFGNRTELKFFHSENGKLQEIKSRSESVEIEGEKVEHTVWTFPGELKVRRWQGIVEEWSTGKVARIGTGLQVWAPAGAKEAEVVIVLRVRQLVVIEPTADGLAALRVRIVPPKK